MNIEAPKAGRLEASQAVRLQALNEQLEVLMKGRRSTAQQIADAD